MFCVEMQLCMQVAGCVVAEVMTSFLALQQLIVGVRGAIWATHLCTYQRLLNEDDTCHVVTDATFAISHV